MKKLNLTEATILALEGKLGKIDIESELEKYKQQGFGYMEIKEIQEGLKKGLDVSKYADPEFNWEQMREIRLGLEDGLDVSKYADPKFNDYQMEEIRYGLKEGIDVSEYADPKYKSYEMKEIRKELSSELSDRKKYQNLSNDEKKKVVNVYTGYNGYKKGFFTGNKKNAKKIDGMETILSEVKLLNGKLLWVRWNDNAREYYSVDLDDYRIFT